MYCPRRSEPANRADAVRDAAGEEPVGAGVGGGLGVPAVPCLDADHDGRAAAVCGALVDRLRMGGRPASAGRPAALSEPEGPDDRLADAAAVALLGRNLYR